MTRIKILKEKKRPTLQELLENKARIVAAKVRSDRQGHSPSWTLEGQIALTLEHIERAKQLHKDLMLNLLRHECYVDTEIMQHDFIHRFDYSMYHFRFRGILQDKLGRIKQERRHFTLALEEKLQPLHDRLLSLLDKHAVFSH